jgi:hypothetical protein
MHKLTIGQTVTIISQDSPLRGRRAIIVDAHDGLYDVRLEQGNYKHWDLCGYTARELAPVNKQTEKETA